MLLEIIIVGAVWGFYGILALFALYVGLVILDAALTPKTWTIEEIEKSGEFLEEFLEWDNGDRYYFRKTTGLPIKNTHYTEIDIFGNTITKQIERNS